MGEIAVCYYSQACIYFYQNQMDFMLVEILVGVQKKIKQI
jgi:hypothetical protein